MSRRSTYRSASATTSRAKSKSYALSLHDRDGRLGMDYGVYGVPETFVIDRKGVIRYKRVGTLTEQIVRKRILPLVKELEHA